VKCLDLTHVPSRRALFSQIDAKAKRVLVIAEGILGYWSPEQVGLLAADLHEQIGFHWWLFEMLSSVVPQSRKSQKVLFYSSECDESLRSRLRLEYEMLVTVVAAREIDG
jgi:O-methyltransferase involved in polyketide biosynthesis